VNLAARLCELAPAGEVLVDEVLAGELASRAGLAPVEPLTIRGRGGRVRAFRLIS
jgi:class 3 adenylate cyclase